MKISEMNKILKEMKEICAFKDNETEIKVTQRQYEPYISNTERVVLETTINGIDVVLRKDTSKSEAENV